MALLKPLALVPGGQTQIASTDQIAVDASVSTVLPTGGEANNGRALADLIKVTPYFSGAVPNGVLAANGTATGTDNTAAFQRYFDWCRDNNEEWFIPKGDWRIAGSLTAYTGGTCEGRLLFPNNGGNKFTLDALASDKKKIPNAEYTAWTGATRLSRKINNLVTGTSTVKKGDLIVVNTESQILVNRIIKDSNNNPVLTPVKLSEVALVSDLAGGLAHSLFTTWNNSAWTEKTTVNGVEVDNAYQAITLREQITVQGLNIVMYSVGSGTSTNSVVNNFRSNVTFSDCTIRNASGTLVSNAFADNFCCNVTHRDGYVDGLTPGSVGYAWNTNAAAGINYVNPREIYCRRGIDAHKSKHLGILAPNLPDGWGAHYSFWMGSVGGTVGASTGTNPQAIQIAGGGFYCVYARGTVSQSADAFVRVRGDYVESDEQIDLTGTTVDFTTALTAVKLIDVSDAITPFDYGRTVRYPNKIVLKNTAVNLLGPSNQTIQIVSWGNPSGTSIPQNYVVDSDWEIDVTLRFQNGTAVLPSTSTPRTQITVIKTPRAIGPGIKARIKNLPGIFLNVSTSSDAVTTDARFSANIENIDGPTAILCARGAYKTIVCNCDAAPTVSDFPGSSGFASLGDEKIIQANLYDLGRLLLGSSSAAFLLANGAPLRVDDVAGMVNGVVMTGGASGVAPKFQATGTDTNVGLSFGTRGTASIGFFTSFATQQLEIAHAANAVNRLAISGGATGSGPTMQATGTDTAIPLNFGTRGAGAINFYTAFSTQQFEIAHTGGAVNWAYALGGTSGQPATLGAKGADANVAHRLLGKGTSGVQVAASNQTVGFYGSAGSGKQTLAAAANNSETTQALANDIRAKLIALGLFS